MGEGYHIHGAAVSACSYSTETLCLGPISAIFHAESLSNHLLRPNSYHLGQLYWGDHRPTHELYTIGQELEPDTSWTLHKLECFLSMDQFPEYSHRRCNSRPTTTSRLETAYNNQSEGRLDGHILGRRRVSSMDFHLRFLLIALSGLIISIIRFKTFFASNAFEDPTMTSIDLVAWTVIEPGMYLIAACLVTLRPLLQLVIKEKIRATSHGSASRGYQLSSSANDNQNAKLQKSGASVVVDSIPLGQFPGQRSSFSDDRELLQKDKDVYDGKTGTQADCVVSPRQGHFGSHQILVEQDYSVTLSRH